MVAIGAWRIILAFDSSVASTTIPQNGEKVNQYHQEWEIYESHWPVQ